MLPFPLACRPRWGGHLASRDDQQPRHSAPSKGGQQSGSRHRLGRFQSYLYPKVISSTSDRLQRYVLRRRTVQQPAGMSGDDDPRAESSHLLFATTLPLGPAPLAINACLNPANRLRHNTFRHNTWRCTSRTGTPWKYCFIPGSIESFWISNPRQSDPRRGPRGADSTRQS